METQDEQNKPGLQIVCPDSSNANSSAPDGPGGGPPGSRRTDAGRLHAVHHGILSRRPLEALRKLGEDLKALRRLERRFWAELRPRGAVAEMLFDRYWSSYLRCLLAARTEAACFLGNNQDVAEKPANRARIIDADVPTLVLEQDTGASLASTPVGRDMLHQLALVQRYDRHFSKEMYRALGLLLVVRSSGDDGLEKAFAALFGLEG